MTNFSSLTDAQLAKQIRVAMANKAMAGTTALRRSMDENLKALRAEQARRAGA